MKKYNLIQDGEILATLSSQEESFSEVTFPEIKIEM